MAIKTLVSSFIAMIKIYNLLNGAFKLKYLKK